MLGSPLTGRQRPGVFFWVLSFSANLSSTRAAQGEHEKDTALHWRILPLIRETVWAMTTVSPEPWLRLCGFLDSTRNLDRQAVITEETLVRSERLPGRSRFGPMEKATKEEQLPLLKHWLHVSGHLVCPDAVKFVFFFFVSNSFYKWENWALRRRPESKQTQHSHHPHRPPTDLTPRMRLRERRWMNRSYTLLYSELLCESWPLVQSLSGSTGWGQTSEKWKPHFWWSALISLPVSSGWICGENAKTLFLYMW